MMTRKNYLSAAEIVRGMRRDNDETGAMGAERAFVLLFSSDNPAFDAARFVEACEYPPAKIARKSTPVNGTYSGVAGGGIVEETLPRRKASARFVGVLRGGSK